MHYKTFFAYNIVGGTLWTAVFTYAGFYIGKELQDLGVNIEIIAIIIVLASVLPVLLHILSSKEKRQTILQGTKRQIKILFKK